MQSTVDYCNATLFWVYYHDDYDNDDDDNNDDDYDVIWRW